MGIFDASEQAKSRRRDRSAAAPVSPGPDEALRERWRAEGKFYEFTGYSSEGVGHPLTVTVFADRVTLTPGHGAPAASEGVARLPVRGGRVEDVALRAVKGVVAEKVTVTQARVTVDAALESLTFFCLQTVAEQVRHDLEAALSRAMIAAAKRAIPEAPVGVVADLIAAEDPGGRIQRLADLRDQGLLTEAEFEAKKRQILGL